MHALDLIPLQRAAHPYGLLYAELGPPPPQHHLITNRIILEEPKTPYAIVLPHTSDTTGTGGYMYTSLRCNYNHVLLLYIVVCMHMSTIEDDKSEENETASQPEVKKCRGKHNL